MKFLKTFEPNLAGKDYVIGDLHGSFSCFTNLLENINFDAGKDRMFSVGDLVDRGPDSYQCMQLLREPWFHSVLSNHEQMMMEAFYGGYSGSYWLPNGGFWGVEALNVYRSQQQIRNGTRLASNNILATDQDLDIIDLVELLAELPYLITINMPNGEKIHVLHAEVLPTEDGITDEDLISEEKVKELATAYAEDGEAFLWARYYFGSFIQADLSNKAKIARSVKFKRQLEAKDGKLSKIISGHSIMQRPFTLLNQTNIDTGASQSYVSKGHGGYEIPAKKWAALTCIDLMEWKFYQSTENTFKEVKPFVISKEDVNATDDAKD
jgi:serine/threonine protein phosphatase 1